MKRNNNGMETKQREEIMEERDRRKRKSEQWRQIRWLSSGLLRRVVSRSLLTFQRCLLPPSSGRSSTAEIKIV
jgi:hypothetical protein